MRAARKDRYLIIFIQLLMVRTRSFRHLVFLLLLLFPLAIEAQIYVPKSQFDHWSQAEGYPATQAICMVKSGESYLWIGTEQGLIRFDGHSFEDFRFNPNDSTGITGTYVSHISIDKYDRLWMGVDQSLNVYDINTNVFTKLLSPDDTELFVKAFYYDLPQDKMWIGTTRGLYVNEGRGLKIRKIAIPEMTGRERIETIQMDLHGNLWMGSTYGIFQFHPDKGFVAEYHRPGADRKDPASDGILSSFLDSTKHLLWLGCWQYGLLKMDLREKTIESFEYQDARKLQNGILDIQLSPLSDQMDQLWLATVDGLMRFDIKDSRFYSYKSDLLNDPGAVNGVPLGFYMADREGLWIGSTTGLYRLDHNKQLFRNISLNLIPEYQQNKIFDIEIVKSQNQRDSLVWLNVDGHGLVYFDLMQGKKIPLTGQLKKYASSTAGITDLYLDTDDKYLWILSSAYGIESYERPKNRLISYSSLSDSNQSISFYSVEPTSRGDLFFASQDELYLLNKTKRGIEPLSELNKIWKSGPLSPNGINIAIDGLDRMCIHIESNQNPRDRWLLYDMNNKRIIEFPSYVSAELKKLSYIKDLHFNQSGKLCISAENGLALIDDIFSQSPEAKTFISTDKRFLARLEAIVNDSMGNFWISSITGIVRLDPISLVLNHLDYSNTTMSRSRNPSVAISPNSDCIFVGQLDMIDVGELGSLKRTWSRPVLTHLDIEGQRIYRKIKSGDVINLKYRNSSVYFEFSDLDFTNAPGNDFYFNFGEGNNQWTDNKGNAFRFYNIRPGKHLFRLRINDPADSHPDREFSLTIDVSRPFWLNWWFYLLVSLVILSIITLIFRYREKERQKIEKMRQALSRDFHDQIGSSLSSIRLLSELEGRKARSNPSFKKIGNNLAEVMQQLSEIIWSIDPKYDSLMDVLTKLCTLGIEIFESRAIGFRFECPPDLDRITLSQEDRRHIYLIVKEGMNNTAKYAEAKNVSLIVVRKNKHLNVILKDDGKGFDQKAVFWGNGLNNMKKRAELLGGNLEVLSGNDSTEIRLSLRI